MRERKKRKESEVKPRLWIVKEEASERLGGLVITEKESKSRLDLGIYIWSYTEKLSLRNKIALSMLSMQEEMLERGR